MLVVEVKEDGLLRETLTVLFGPENVVLECTYGQRRAERDSLMVVGIPAMSLSVLPPKLTMMTEFELKLRWMSLMRSKSEGRKSPTRARRTMAFVRRVLTSRVLSSASSEM